MPSKAKIVTKPVNVFLTFRIQKRMIVQAKDSFSASGGLKLGRSGGTSYIKPPKVAAGGLQDSDPDRLKK